MVSDYSGNSVFAQKIESKNGVEEVALPTIRLPNDILLDNWGKDVQQLLNFSRK